MAPYGQVLSCWDTYCSIWSQILQSCTLNFSMFTKSFRIYCRFFNHKLQIHYTFNITETTKHDTNTAVNFWSYQSPVTKLSWYLAHYNTTSTFPYLFIILIRNALSSYSELMSVANTFTFRNQGTSIFRISKHCLQGLFNKVLD